MKQRYISLDQAEYLLQFSNAKQLKSSAASALIKAVQAAKSLNPLEQSRQLYLDYDDSAVVESGQGVLFYFDAKAIDVAEFNNAGKDQ